MDKGQSLIIPPLFDGTNYAYWKVHMRVFLQSLDENVLQVMEISWTKPKEVLADSDNAKIKVVNFNSRALNALFSAVTNEEFKKISSTKTTKEAWTFLQTTYEETKAVNDSNLQRLTTSFEEIFKVVIYNYIFLLVLFHDKMFCNCFNFVLCILWDFIVLGLVLSW